jgi:hypothetical protein
MKNILASVFFIFSSTILYAQAPAIKWQKALGGSSFDVSYGIIQCADSNFIMVGTVQSNDGDVTGNKGLYDIWVVKLSKSGNIIWKKTYGGTGSDYGSSISQTNDGGYVIAGYTNSTDGNVTGHHGKIDGWVLKISDTGAVQWQRALGGSEFDAALSAKQTADSGYIVAGWSGSMDGDLTTNKGSEDCWVVKLTPAGVISWKHSLGGSGEDHASSAMQTADGGYIVAGTVKSTDFDIKGNHGGADYILYKLSSTGSLLWQKCYGGTGVDACGEHGYAGAVKQTPDGGYVLSGWSNSTDGNVTGNHGDYDAWIIRVNDTGGLKWQKSLGGAGDDEANYVALTPDGGIIVAALSDSISGQVSGGHGDHDFWLLKLDSLGTIVWQQCYGGDNYDIAFQMERTYEGNYIASGFAKSNNGQVTGHHGDFDAWVAYLEDPMEVAPIDKTAKVGIYPNPTSGVVRLSNLPVQSQVRIFNGQGQMVKRAFNTVTLSVDDLSQGLYYICIYDGEGVLVAREKLLKI